MTQFHPSDKESFLAKVKRYAGKIPGSKSLMAMYYCMEDPGTPWKVKFAIAGCVGYVLNPADPLGPDPIFFDDGGVISTTLYLVETHITDEHREKARRFFEQEG